MKRLMLITLAAAMLVFLLVPAAASAQENWYDILPRPEWSGLTEVQIGADQGWFEVYRIKPNVYAIYEESQWEEVISYLFVGTRRALLFDTGMNIGDMKQLTDALTDKPVFVVNSHGHADHFGCNYEYRCVWAFDDAEGWARFISGYGWPHDEAMESGEFEKASFWPFCAGGNRLPRHFNKRTYYVPPYTITHWVKEGDVIDLGNMRLTVYSTPGHSTDSISLLDREHGLLAVGDVWYNSWLGCFDLRAYTATAAKLARLSKAADYVLPSHNVTMVSAHWMVKMDDAFRAINNGTATNYFDDIYPDDPASNGRYFEFGYFGVYVPWSELGL
jgi:glyoxylase-like metal-dependent hydrolase (beta-lactamase superfamily II)